MTAEQLLRAFAVTGIVAEQARVGQLLHPLRLKLKQRQILVRLRYPTPRPLVAQRIPPDAQRLTPPHPAARSLSDRGAE